MPPKKRAATASSTRAKRHRPSDLQEAGPSSLNPTPQDTGLMQINVQALTNTIAVAVTQAVKDVLVSQRSSGNSQDSSQTAPTAPQVVERAVDDEVIALTQAGTNRASVLPLFEAGDQPRQLFSSIAVNLGARVNDKVKAKIWANEYVDFGALLSVAPPREKFAVSMTSVNGDSSGQPQLTLEPFHTPKKVTNINQWLTAFNTFVSIYAEKASDDAPKLMKYCEVVRDLFFKSGDWLFYDEQFRYLRQSSPALYPWDQIHWELWLRAMTNSNFRSKPQSSYNGDRNSKGRFRASSGFPKGTCWAFQAGKQCGGCQYEHICYKCGAKHPATQCSRPHVGKSGISTQSQSSGQPASHARKSGSS